MHETIIMNKILHIVGARPQFIKLFPLHLEMKERGFKEGANHKKIYRPWGSYTTLIEGNEWLVKRIEVNPNAKLSLQMHKFRAEHWIVVGGKASVEIDKKSFFLEENQSTFIPLGSMHRLSNPNKSLLTIIEIQSGEKSK